MAVDPQQLAREKMDQLSAAAQEHGKQAAELARKGIGSLAGKMGKFALGTTIALWIGWFFLPFYSFSATPTQRDATQSIPSGPAPVEIFPVILSVFRSTTPT